MNAADLMSFSLRPFFASLRRWWHRCAERHYLRCAEVEQERVRESQMNVAYYEKRAALARSASMGA